MVTHHPHVRPTDKPILHRVSCSCGNMKALLVTGQRAASAVFYTHLGEERGKGG